MSAALLQEWRTKSNERIPRLLAEQVYSVSSDRQSNSRESEGAKLETLTLPTQGPTAGPTAKGPTPFQTFQKTGPLPRPPAEKIDMKRVVTTSDWAPLASQRDRQTQAQQSTNPPKVVLLPEKHLRTERSGSNLMPKVLDDQVEEYLTAYVQQPNVIDGSKFVARDPIYAVKVKNNERRFEELISQ